jgi:hypothetical protein
MRRHTYLSIMFGLITAVGMLSITGEAKAQRPRGGRPGFAGTAGMGGMGGTRMGAMGMGAMNMGMGTMSLNGGMGSNTGFQGQRFGNANAFNSFGMPMSSFGQMGMPSANLLLARPAGTTTINLSHPTSTSTLIRVNGPSGTSRTTFTQPTAGTTQITRTSQNSFNNTLSAFRLFQSDLQQFRPIINGTTTVSRPSSNSIQFSTTLRNGGTATTTVSHPTPLRTVVTTTRPSGTSTTSLQLSSTGNTVRNNSTITFNDAMQGFRSFDPVSFLGSFGTGTSTEGP